MAVDVTNLTNGKILDTMLTFIKVVQATEVNKAYKNLINEGSFLIFNLISDTAGYEEVQFKLIGDDLVARELITYCLKLLEKRNTKDSLVA